MQSESASGADWRDAAAYAPLLAADRAFVAWEWLRRDPAYRSAFDRALPDHTAQDDEQPEARAFGLVRFEAPYLAVPRARPMWRSEACPSVLAAERSPTIDAGDAFDLAALAETATLVRGRDADHLLLSDGLSMIRLDGSRGLFCREPVRLRYVLEGLVTVRPQLLTLRRLVAFCRTRSFARSLHPPERRARRWLLMLRAWDALCAGASQRELAQVLFSRSAAEPRWRSREPSVRSQAQRLAGAARAFASGGYLTLLGGYPGF